MYNVFKNIFSLSNEEVVVPESVPEINIETEDNQVDVLDDIEVSSQEDFEVIEETDLNDVFECVIEENASILNEEVESEEKKDEIDQSIRKDVKREEVVNDVEKILDDVVQVCKKNIEKDITKELASELTVVNPKKNKKLLFVSDLPPNTTKAELLKIFGKYDLEKVSLTSITISPQFGYITFINYREINKAMSMEHKIRGKKITMEKFDYRLPTVEEPSLLVLNDKCLLKILGYIKPSGNYTALTKVCHRIKRLINKLAISQTKLDVTDWALSGGELSVNRIRNFNEMFNIVCPYVTDIKMFHIRVAYPGFVNIMKKAFCRVKSLDLRKSAVVVEQIPWSFLTQLKSLNLSECCVTDDTVNLIVEQCPMLEDIDLSCNDEITGKHIWKIQKLKSLNLSWCPKLNVKSFNLILRQIPHLKALRLNGCLNLQGSSMALIASSLSHMNTLDLGFANPQCDWIPVLVRVGLSEISTLDISQCPLECKMIYLTLNKSKNLQRLKMNFVKGLEDDFFNNLNLKKLTELSCSSCKNINAMAVIDFISKSPNLSLLDISDCSNISTKTLSTIASIVSKRPKSVDLDLLFAFGKGSKKVPLKMHFCGRK